jgi:acetolactate synthase I/II/III large subunit
VKVVDAIANAIAIEGLDVAFIVPDEVTVHLAQALQEQGVLRIVRPRHEQNAVLMADGHARATGKPAVCAVGAGPALAQTGTGLVTAQRKGSPVLVLVGGIPYRGSAKEFDRRRFAESTGARYLEVRSNATVRDDMYEAFRAVRLRRGPVVLSIPNTDGLYTDLLGGWQYRATSEIAQQPLAVDPASDAVEEAAAILASSRRPIIIAGWGAVAAGARDEIERLADRMGALLATSLQAREYFRGHHRNIGLIGNFATEATLQLLAEADSILAVGISLNRYQTGGGPLAPNARVIQIDREPTKIGEFTPVDLALIGDARTTIGAINRCLELAEISQTSIWSSDAAQALIVAARARPKPAEAPSSDRLPISRVLAQLEEVLPEDRVVIVDAGLFLVWTIDAISVPDPNSWVWSQDFGSIGLGIALGIGTALGKPDRHCVVFAGDGGFMMNPQELETAARERIPLTIVILNDGTYAPETKYLKMRDKPPDLAIFQDVDIAAVACGFGARGVTLRTLEDIPAVAEHIANRNGPLVIDAKITEEEDHRYVRSHYT